MKPSAPASRSSAISVSASPARPRGDRGEEADGHARLAPRGLAQRAQDRRGVDHRVGVGHRDHARRSRRPRPRGCRSRGPPCARGRACAGARAGRRSRGTDAGPRRRRPRRPPAPERAGRAELGDLAVADEHVVRRVDPGARVEHVGAADQQRRRARVAATSGRAHAGAFAGARSRELGASAGGVGRRSRRGPRAARRGRPCARRRRPRPARR